MQSATLTVSLLKSTSLLNAALKALPYHLAETAITAPSEDGRGSRITATICSGRFPPLLRLALRKRALDVPKSARRKTASLTQTPLGGTPSKVEQPGFTGL